MCSGECSVELEELVCSSCRKRLFNLDSFQEAWLKGSSYRTTWNEIQEADRKSCGWCNMIHSEVLAALTTMGDTNQTQFQGPREEIDEMEKGIREDDIYIKLSFQDEYHTGREKRNLLIITYGSPDGYAWFLSTIPLSTPSDDPAAPFIPDRPTICEMSSSETYQLVHDCLQECSQRSDGHENCPTCIPTTLPTRVLDCQDSNNPKLKGDTVTLEEYYAALSYVWGEDQPQRTTTSNLEQYITVGLDLQVTPQTIKDAIRVVHELGIRYLWIDTYCIIQDSPEDKVNEISRMRRIYQNACFTIIAAKTPKVSVGFLHDCPPPCSTFHVPFYCSDGRLGSMILAPRAWHNLYEAAQEPINRRAWCLQERILSPRALVYASHTLQYLCQRGLKPIGGSYTPTTVNSIERLPTQFFEARYRDYGVSDPLPTSDELRALSKVWHQVLNDYTPRGLTVSADKLSAIAGVAEEFQHLLKCKYIAGMWEHNLLGDLLWNRGTEDPLPRPEEYRAPSWAWPSINGVVHHLGGFVEPKEEYSFSILEWALDIVDSISPFGQVRGGYLKVEGRLKKMMWDPERGLLYEQDSESDFSVVGGCFVDSLDDVRGVGIIEEIWSLPIALKVKKGNISSRDVPRRLLGILLKPITGTNEHTYRRVGSFRMSLEGRVEADFKATPRSEITVI